MDVFVRFAWFVRECSDMMIKLGTAVAVAVLAAGTASASTVGPIFGADRIEVESDNNRPNAGGDVSNNGALDLGFILPGERVGVAGRILTAIDSWTFQTTRAWTMSLVNLDLDDNQGFDSSNILAPAGNYQPNGDTTRARFSLFDNSDPNAPTQIGSAVELTATMDGLLTGLDFSGGAGSYLLRINGALSNPGATYDIGITAPVPLPASLPLLIGGIGALAALRRRKAA